ncbi:MAG: glucokinase [Thiogranum sp.]|nr:glucokinase [Thiogranum sp.]
MRILAGDIGGTNTRLALLEWDTGTVGISCRQEFSSLAHESLNAVVAKYLGDQGDLRLDAAAFGVAGPVRGGISQITNLPWRIAQAELSEQLGLSSVYLLNDLEALAWSVETLHEDQLTSLQTGLPGPGNRAVIAAGTGLGQAGLFFDGEGYQPFATEGGHADFAATQPQDWELCAFLQKRFGRTSWERVVSGPGMVHLYEFLLEQSGNAAPDWWQDPGQDMAAAITERGLASSDPLCYDALHWFVRLYGAEAGNLALKMKAIGGLYIGGGIAPKILPALQMPAFMHAFLDKGKMRGLLEAMPVRVICYGDAALQGLGNYAARRAAGGAII